MRSFAQVIICEIGKAIAGKLMAGFDFGKIARQIQVDGSIAYVIGEEMIRVNDNEPFTAFHLIHSISPGPAIPFSSPTGASMRINAAFVIVGFDYLSEPDALSLIEVFSGKDYRNVNAAGATTISGTTEFIRANNRIVPIIKDYFRGEYPQQQQQSITAIEIMYTVVCQTCDFCIA